MWQSSETRPIIDPMAEPLSRQPLAEAVLRRGQPNDAAAIASVHVESWRTTYAGLLPDGYLVGMNVTRCAALWSDVLVNRPCSEAVFVIDAVPCGVVGFCSCGRARRDWPRSLRNGGEVYTLYVDPDHQGAGYGRALLERGLAHLREAGFLDGVVWVLDGNPARFFYQALGAHLVMERSARFAGAAIRELGYKWDWAGADPSRPPA